MLAQLQQWSDKMPDANLGLLGRDLLVGDICFLEFDQGGLAEAAAEMGQPVPVTRIHISGGKGLEHCAFRQIERSLNLGNRNANRNGKEWFSLRMNNRYVLGPGSIHPDTGKPYTVAVDIIPADFPDWLVDWIERYTVSEFTAAGGKDMPEVDEDFDFEQFRDWLPFSLSQDGHWYIAEFCLGVGRKHEHSKKTGIFFDGTHLCWKCFAQNCPCAYNEDGSKFTIGDLIHRISEEQGAYDGVIWPEQDGSDWADFDDDIVPGAKAPDKATKADQHLNTLAAFLMGTEPEQKHGLEPPKTFTPVQAPTSNTDKSRLEAVDDLAFPEECIKDDKLGDMARDMQMPLGLAYPAVLACVSVKPTLDRMCGARLNLYTCLIVKPGGGKNEAIRRAIEVTDLTSRVDYLMSAPGGDAQLVSLLGDRPSGKRGDRERIPGPKRLLLICNEIGDMLSKTGIDNSTLATRMCDFWDCNEYDKPTGKSGEVAHVDCRLSWLGGLPASVEKPEKFSELFGGQTNYGLDMRFIYGYTGTKFNHKDWERPRKSVVCHAIADEDDALESLSFTASNGITVVRTITEEAMAIYEAWEPGGDAEGRLKYNAKKIAILKAAFIGESEVSARRMRQAIIFMEWQIKLRKVFKPGQAKESNREAWFTEHLIPAIERAGAFIQFVNWRRISLNNHWDEKIDAGVQLRTIKNLVSLGRLIEEEPEEKGKRNKFPKVMLRTLTKQ